MTAQLPRSVFGVRAAAHPCAERKATHNGGSGGTATPSSRRTLEPVAAMIEQGERYRALVELAPDAIAVHRDGRLVFSNAAAVRMLGAQAPDDLLGRSLLQFTAPSYHDVVRARFRDALEHDAAQPPIEVELVRLDGTTIHAEVSTVPILFDGAPALLSFARDVTEQHRAREILEHTVSLQHATLESTTDGLLVVDTEGRIVSYNRQFADMWRIPEQVLEQGYDRAALAFVLDQLIDPAQFLSKVQELYAQRDAKSFDVLQFKDGRTFERYSQPQRVAGRSVGRVWGFRDVTERERLAQRIARLEKMEAVARFASGVAHDFNNLLTIVRSYADLLVHQLGSDEPHLADVQQIRRATDRAASLARQLLLFSRRSPQAPRRIRVCAFLQELRPMLERLVAPDISLEMRAQGEVPEVIVDIEQLERVMINLVMNAVDAIAGRGTIGIDAGTIDLNEQAASAANIRPGPYVVISVTDNGSGMGPDVLAHLFEPFFTTKPPGQGTGLGLATVFGIIRQAGGMVDVESALQRGTTVRILLPVAGPDGGD
ncbi:MAG: PAS domain S-box protein [Gemmatimonadota bacterium]|nr:PAS domain S-box protein [Gemmatimonadota bacterium]